jgi:hypothetical protein
VIAADRADHDREKSDGQDQQRDRGHALADEMSGAGARRTKAANAAFGGAIFRGGAHRGPPIAR